MGRHRVAKPCWRCGGQHLPQSCDSNLSRQQWCITRLVRQHPDGLTTRQIAELLCITVDRAQFHLCIIRKTGELVKCGHAKYSIWSAKEHAQTVQERVVAEAKVRNGERRRRNHGTARKKREAIERDEVDSYRFTHSVVPAVERPTPKGLVRCVFDYAQRFA